MTYPVWESRFGAGAAAEGLLVTDHPSARAASRLVSRPRRRFAARRTAQQT